MSRSLNKVLLIGNLTRDPEIRYTANGVPVASFGLATNRSWKDNNGEIQEAVEFHNIVAWSKMAEICQQILAKGMMVYIEGSLNTRTWEDESGKTNYKTEIRVSEMKLLDSKGKQGAGFDESKSQESSEEQGESNSSSDESKNTGEDSAGASEGSEDNSSEEVLEDDLPF